MLIDLMDTLFLRAEQFYTQYFAEKNLGSPKERLEEIRREIDLSGTYWQRPDELEYGARMAWRNSNRCIGRLFWKTLKVRDMRHVETEEMFFESVEAHIRYATNQGKIRSTISIFRPEIPDKEEHFRIWNAQAIHFAGYQAPDRVVGDPAELEFTKVCQALGWKGTGSDYDLLPLVIQKGQASPKWFELSKADVLEVSLTHPNFKWFETLHLKWYALPMITNMVLEIGGVFYPAAPFNGWYMSTEIAARNLGDVHRYHTLPRIAERMGLDTSKRASLWKDRALVELNAAVLHSFEKAQVTLIDHHTASEQFIHFTEAEVRSGRAVQADWTWIVPPMSGSTTPVFHRDWPNEVRTPNFFYNTPVWKTTPEAAAKCPFHIDVLQT